MSLEPNINLPAVNTDYPATYREFCIDLLGRMQIANQNQLGITAGTVAPLSGDQKSIWIDTQPSQSPNHHAISLFINGAWREVTGPPSWDLSDLTQIPDGYYIGHSVYIPQYKCFWVWNGSAWEYPGVPGETKFVSLPTLAEVLERFPGWIHDTEANGRVIAAAIENDPEFSPGQKYGERTHTLSIAEMPSHDHQYADAGGGDLDPPEANANFPTGDKDARTGATGGDEPHNNIQPTLARWAIIKT